MPQALLHQKASFSMAMPVPCPPPSSLLSQLILLQHVRSGLGCSVGGHSPAVPRSASSSRTLLCMLGDLPGDRASPGSTTTAAPPLQTQAVCFAAQSPFPLLPENLMFAGWLC